MYICIVIKIIPARDPKQVRKINPEEIFWREILERNPDNLEEESRSETLDRNPEILPEEESGRGIQERNPG